MEPKFVRFVIQDGISPFILQFTANNISSWVRFAKDNGMSLPILIELIRNLVIEDSLAIHEKVAIVNSLEPTFKILSLVRFAKDGEGSPLKLLFPRFITTSCVRLLSEEGIYP
jgi:hypothetical protein